MTAFERGLRRGLMIVVVALLPYVVIMTGVRLVVTHAFLMGEYYSPGFPPDPYGFTLQDRLHWSELSWDYMLNSSGISFLADLRFTDGTPIYNERELSHMGDVKAVVQTTLALWRLSLVVLVLVGLAAWRRRWVDEYRRALSLGGWITAGLVIAILVGVATNFDWLFTEFHRIFFTGNSWLFYYSDTLIRLFPIHFWILTFTFVGIFSLVAGGFIGYFLGDLRLGKRVVVAE